MLKQLLSLIILTFLLGCVTNPIERPKQYSFVKLISDTYGPNCKTFYASETYAADNIDIYDSPYKCEFSEKYKNMRRAVMETARQLDKERNSKIEASYNKKIDFLIKERPEFKKYETSLKTHKISIGMPESLIEVAWGKPESVRSTVLANSINKQFVYKNYNYVYTQNGFITGIQVND